MDDETVSSKEDLISKARKPYTITKQRERWTTEEHNRFLEAIKLYGRAWQRIEEHIGTKTAVQIRSHAQKFFTKLEKEALNKGVALGQARDIDIPPPRPKRKPSNPYPRKTSSCTPDSILTGTKDENPLNSVSSSHSDIQTLDLEKDVHPQNTFKSTIGKENFDEESSLCQETPCTSLSLKDKCVFREFIPPVEERSNTEELDRSDANCTDLDGKVRREEEGKQNYPRHIPVQVLESSSSENHSNITIQKQSVVENFPSLLGQVSSNHDGYNMFVNTTFQNLLVSTLVQNPAAHAAASLAASLWPFTTTVETCPGPIEGPSPSISAIAAATVMAASAWWAAHGLLPLCPPPLHAGFTCAPVPTDPSPSDISPVLVENESANEKKSVSIKEQPEDKAKPKEQVDRSSCGSNTPSSSEVETDLHANANDEIKEHNNRNRSLANLTESWKEVSEEGKIAFKALFSREVLPQSFSPPKQEEIHKEKLEIDLNSNMMMTQLTCVENEQIEKRRTGFKPYKRCSMEESSNENNQAKERDAKRVCLQGEASV